MSEASDFSSTNLTLAEKLTADFYLWERRGRGWDVWGEAVELEPPFRPFYHFYRPVRVPDDGQRPSILGQLLSRLWPSPPSSETAESAQDDIYEPRPSSLSTGEQVCELEVSLRPDESVGLDSAEQLLVSLGGASGPLGFEILGAGSLTRIRFTCQEPDLAYVVAQIRAYFPGAVIEENNGYLARVWSRKPTVIVEFGLAQEFMRPLRTFRRFEPDPLTGTIGAMENLAPEEIGLLQILFQPARGPWAENILRAVTDWDGRCFFDDDPAMLSLAREKIESPLFSAVLRVVSQADNYERAWEIARMIGAAFWQLENPESNELFPLENNGYDDAEHAQDVLRRQSQRSGVILNLSELAGLVHLPAPGVRAGKLVRELKKTRAAPAIAKGHALTLGENWHQGEKSTVGLSLEQRLRHTYIVGATGTGKSTLLLNMIVQDIAQGTGFAVLDPHGDLIDAVLARIPSERHRDVVLLDASDAEYPVGLNILSARSDLEKTVLSSDLVAVFRRLATSWGDQMTSVLGNAVLAILDSTAGGTLLELRRFLVERDYRARFLETVRDPSIVYYWQHEYALLSGRPQGSVLTRLDAFLRPTLIRNMVGRRECLDFQEILNGRRIFLAKLAQGLIGQENAYLLGALLVSKLHQAAMARQAKATTERPPFFLYIDEFQNFICPSMADILSGARKYALGLVLAHQELRQLAEGEKEIASSVISNPATRICFRLGDFDARRLEEGFSSFTAQDLQNLGVGEAVVRVERAEYDFNLKVSPVPAVNSEQTEARVQELIRLSRERYGQPVSEAPPATPFVHLPPTPRKGLTIPAAAEPLTPERPEPEAPRRIKKTRSSEPQAEGKGGPQHRYLQALVKQMAEAAGYRATIEQQVTGGSVDVGLERDGEKIACEISVTSTGAQELGNIEKCLAAGYQEVIACSPDARTLERIQKLATKEIPVPDRSRIFFLKPEDLMAHLEKKGAARNDEARTVKGYRVRVSYQPGAGQDQQNKRAAVAKVIAGAMQRMKQ